MKRELSIEEIQYGSFQILKAVAALCDKLKMNYYLAYGTLIGAIRHKGFIPWDDDIDIMMPRADYNKLLAYFIEHEKELYPLKLFSTVNNRKYPYMISRISDDRYELDVNNEVPFGMGLFIDIYPLDGVGNSKAEYTKLKNKASKYSSMCFLSTRMKCVKGNTKSKFKLAIKYPVFLYAKARGKDHWIWKLNEIAKHCDYQNSKYIGCLVWGSDGIKGIFPKKWFESTVDVSFEGYTFKAPANFHEVLTQLYRDYMKLPPKKERKAHHFYNAYRKENTAGAVKSDSKIGNAKKIVS